VESAQSKDRTARFSISSKRILMPKKQASSSVSPPGPSTNLPSPRSRRQELLEALLASTQNPTHTRILNAYMTSQTVQGAEDEFSKIIEELVDET
jgi:hypothetical protein